MSNKYLDMSEDELHEVADAAMWAYAHKHELYLDLSFEVSDTSWKCQFSTITLEELDVEARKIAEAFMFQALKKKTRKWYQKILTPNFKVSLIVVSVVLFITLLLSLVGV